MVHIISRGEGPRREDHEARRLIDNNRATITKLADTLSNGAYSASRSARAEQKDRAPDGLIIADYGAGRRPDVPEPRVNISLNRRVVVVDDATSRQMHHLGELRRQDGVLRFVLATKENGFFTPVTEEIAAALAPLDGAEIGGDRTAESLRSEIAKALGTD